MSKLQDEIAGLGAGASTGAAVGAVAGPEGAIVGAAIGAVFGFFAGEICHVTPQQSTSKSNSETQDKGTPDPVVSAGSDYAGMAHAVRGPIDHSVFLGIGNAMKSYGVSQSRKRTSTEVAREVARELAKHRRKRPHHHTRSWDNAVQNLKRKFDEIRGEWVDWQDAARIVGPAFNALERGHHGYHLEL